MTKRDLQVIVDAYNRLIKLQPINLADYYPDFTMVDRGTMALEVSKDDYEALEPFFNGTVSSHYTIGSYEAKTNGRIFDHGYLRIGDRHYIRCFGDTTVVQILRLKILIEMLAAGDWYKRVPKSAIYGESETA